MRILGIETSCDETALAILNIDDKHLKISASNISSQTTIHQKWGGVVPELAARRHAEVIIPLLKKTLTEAKISPQNIDAIAVTLGPGLITSLQVGVETAKTLAWSLRKPLIPVNHISGHIISSFLTSGQWRGTRNKSTFPVVALVVSGGHTELYLIKNLGQQKLLGRTLDDATGEAFDKVAKMLKLPYPGGPQVAKLAACGNPTKFNFPRPMIYSNNLNFSFAGLKTAVLYTLKKLPGTKNEELVANICASFQQAAIDVLAKKTIKAATTNKAKTILLGGGVSANKLLRSEFKKASANLPRVKLLISPLEFTGDNAVMIAAAGYIEAKKSGLKVFKNSWSKINADANWELW